MRGWSKRNADKLKLIGDKAAANVWLTNHTAKHYENIDSRLDVFITIALYLLGSGGVPSLFASESVKTIQIVNGAIQGLLICVGMLSTWKKTMDYKAKIKKQNWASAKYSDLFTEIQSTFQLNTAQRPRFKKFYQKMKEKELKLQRCTPFIPKQSYRVYYETMKEKALRRELLIGNYNEIEIFISENKPVNSSVIPSSKELEETVQKSKSLRHTEYRRSYLKTRSKNIPGGAHMPPASAETDRPVISQSRDTSELSVEYHLKIPDQQQHRGTESAPKTASGGTTENLNTPPQDDHNNESTNSKGKQKDPDQADSNNSSMQDWEAIIDADQPTNSSLQQATPDQKPRHRSRSRSHEPRQAKRVVFNAADNTTKPQRNKSNPSVENIKMQLDLGSIENSKDRSQSPSRTGTPLGNIMRTKTQKEANRGKKIEEKKRYELERYFIDGV